MVEKTIYNLSFELNEKVLLANNLLKYNIPIIILYQYLFHFVIFIILTFCNSYVTLTKLEIILLTNYRNGLLVITWKHNICNCIEIRKVYDYDKRIIK